MKYFFDISNRLTSEVPVSFKRSLYDQINWKKRLIGIKGSRGTGKTTLLLQYLKKLDVPSNKKLYLSLDDLYFTENSLFYLASDFYKVGGRWLFIDEVHKYRNWAKEIKNLYDYYSDLKLIFTGSSIIEITKEEGDLSRRAGMYELPGLSYREYLNFNHNFRFAPMTLDEIVAQSFDPTFIEQFNPLEYFTDYLKTGYYPFYDGDINDYFETLRQMARLIIEYDMTDLKGFDIRNAKKLIQLIYVIAQGVPFKPNYSKLADRIKIHRNSINNYIIYLEKARLLNQVFNVGKGLPTIQKAEKLYLENTNLAFALADEAPSIGNIRETFFLNQLLPHHTVKIPERGDFEINGKYLFEVGGKNKSGKQIKSESNAHIVKDNIEYPSPKVLPLWLFGFLY